MRRPSVAKSSATMKRMLFVWASPVAGAKPRANTHATSTVAVRPNSWNRAAGFFIADKLDRFGLEVNLGGSFETRAVRRQSGPGSGPLADRVSTEFMSFQL